MMSFQLPPTGGASDEQRQQGTNHWLEKAKEGGIDISAFPRDGTLKERLAWALLKGLAIGLTLARYSGKLQQSTLAQLLENLTCAVKNLVFIPAEFFCVDEAVSGRKSRRAGLDRARAILRAKLASVIFLFKISRLFRVGYKGFAFVQEEVVDEGLRAVSVTQNIDTIDIKTWKYLMYLHGLSDEMLLGTIADHVYAGQKALFQQRFIIGALTVGYVPEEVPGAALTKQGRPRTMARICPNASVHIRTAFEDVAAGMPLRRAYRKYVAAGGASDPRAKDRKMSYNAFRRMLSNRRYVGIWSFGQRRNVWNSKLDGIRTQERPQEEIVVVQCEELRIIDDDLFERVQARLAKLKLGPHTPRKPNESLKLSDLTVGMYFCTSCHERFYTAGSSGQCIRCKNGANCPQPGIVDRGDSTLAVCRELASLLEADSMLVEETVAKTVELDNVPESQILGEVEAIKVKLSKAAAKFSDLSDLAGQGSDEERAALKSKIRAVQAETADLMVEKTRLEQRLANREALKPEEIRAVLADLANVLEKAANGELGQEALYRALSVFRALTGGKIEVQFTKRPGRKQTVVKAAFELHVIAAVEAATGTTLGGHTMSPKRVEVWLRPPPRCDLLAERVHLLVAVQGKSYREAAKILQGEGHKVNSGNVWTILRRYCEMHGLPMPDRPYNNGHPRGE